MDILSALNATEPTRTSDRCKVKRWIDDIPDETPGKAELAATFEERDAKSPNYRTLADLTALAAALGHPMSKTVVGDHARRHCRCYGYSA